METFANISTGVETAKEICEAVGITWERVVDLTIHICADEPVTLTVTKIVDMKQEKKVVEIIRKASKDNEKLD